MILKFLIAISIASSFSLLINAQLTKVIKVNNVTIGSLPNHLKVKTNIDDVLKGILNITDDGMIKFSKLEEFATNKSILEVYMHPFVQAVHWAYAHHLPLIITPDMIWYLIASGTAIHINKNAEKLRNKFVSHQGQMEIIVRRDHFNFNSTNNSWGDVIAEFSQKIEENSKMETAKLFMANFTTTTNESLVASQIVLMDSMKKYFSFVFVTLCGIPELRIMGVKEDWLLIKSRIATLNATIDDLSVWYAALDQIIQKFVDIFDEKIDETFWNQIYKTQGGSGGPYISGWSVAFFPYLNDGIQNYFVWEKKWMDAYNSREFGGLTTRHFSMSFNIVSFKWVDLFKEYDMLFVGGMFGIYHDELDKSLRPIFGYGISEKKS